MQYGVLTKKGYVHSEPHWTSIDLLFKGAHGMGMEHIGDWGILVCRENDTDEWEEVKLDV